MWTTSNGTRNRVSPNQNEDNKQNEYSHSTDWDEPIGTQKSKQLDIKKNEKGLQTSRKLPKFISKRRDRRKESDMEKFLKTGIKKQWTPHLSELKRDKTKSDALNQRKKQRWRKCQFHFNVELWRYWFKRIEGQQGTGVLSYFVFLKWILFLNVYLFLVVFWFIVFPAKVFDAKGYTSVVTGGDCCSASTINTTYCSKSYVDNVSFADNPVQDFIQGSGWMENTLMFYGRYVAEELKVGTSNYLMPFGYFMTVLGVWLLSLIRMTMFFSTSATLKESLYDSEEHCYFHKVLGCWDYALNDEVTSLMQTKSLYKDIIANLDYQRYMSTRSKRTIKQTCRIYTIRFMINILILGMLCGSVYLIYWVNDWATSYLKGASSSQNVIVLIVEFLPSLTITLLNVIVPLIFELLVKLEDYSEKIIVKLKLIRTVFLRLSSLAVLMVSLYVNITCSTKDYACNVGESPCTKLRCWETYVGQSFYKLMVMDFFVHFLVIFCYELPRRVFTTKCSYKISKKIGPAEFDVSQSVLDLVYTQALCWIGLLYCPLITVCSVINSFTQFYLKLFSALYTTIPPNKPYKASKSNNFFMVVLMVTFFLCCFPVGYSMVKIRPSTGCGPFRIYSVMSICVNTTIANFPDWLQGILNVFASGAFIVSLLAVLSLVIYYLYIRGRAHIARAEVMKERLLEERKDKTFLLAKINGEEPKPRALPKPKLPPITLKNEYEFPSIEDTKIFIDNNVPPPPAYDEKDDRTNEHIELTKQRARAKKAKKTKWRRRSKISSEIEEKPPSSNLFIDFE